MKLVNVKYIMLVREYLEDMKPFILDHFAVVTKQIHTDLQMITSVNVLSHNIEVDSIQQELSKQLDGLALCDIRT